MLVSGCLFVAHVLPLQTHPKARRRGRGRAAAEALQGDLCSAWCWVSYGVTVPWQQEAVHALITRQHLLIKDSSALISRCFGSAEARGAVRVCHRGVAGNSLCSCCSFPLLSPFQLSFHPSENPKWGTSTPLDPRNLMYLYISKKDIHHCDWSGILFTYQLAQGVFWWLWVLLWFLPTNLNEYRLSNCSYFLVLKESEVFMF